MAAGKQGDYSEREQLLGITEVLQCLMAYLVVSNKVPREKIAGIVTLAADKLDTEGQPGAAKAVRTVFAGALGQEWENVRILAQAPTSKPAS